MADVLAEMKYALLNKTRERMDALRGALEIRLEEIRAVLGDEPSLPTKAPVCSLRNPHEGAWLTRQAIWEAVADALDELYTDEEEMYQSSAYYEPRRIDGIDLETVIYGVLRRLFQPTEFPKNPDQD